MKKKISILFILIFTANLSLFSEHIYLSGRASFTNAQFWERFIADDSSVENKKVMSNLTGGSFGLSMEWVIWDIGIKRGSRIFLTTGIDAVFLGLNYMGFTEDTIKYQPINEINISGGAMFSGLDLDLYFGGTFPRMDLKWGFGSDFYFMFPTYTGIDFQKDENFFFFAAPSIFIAYDFFIPNTKVKITPTLKTGITTVPLIPGNYIDNNSLYKRSAENWYSGLYIDLSVSISFAAFEWKK